MKQSGIKLQPRTSNDGLGVFGTNNSNNNNKWNLEGVDGKESK
jgi:hypothetical protein